jgi:two-component system, sensor histidine kinase and response regulator
MQLSQKKILVIEDDASLREFMIKYFLEKQGFAVVTAENGLIGLEKARVEIPDLIISDIMMPQMNGYEVLRELQQDVRTSEIPFIFLTAMSNRSDIRDGMNLGADDFLVKPFMSHELLAAINKRFEKKKSIESRANQRLDKFRKDIARVLPHEFRTPLSTILGVSNILLDECDSMDKDELREMISFVNVSAKRLNRLIENYLLYVSLDHSEDPNAAKPSTQMSAFLLNEMLLQTISKHDRSSDLIMEANENHADTLALQMDESYLGKVIEELADNACKFSDKGTPLRVTSVVQGNDYIFSISNTGIGVTPEQIKAIGAFVQFDRESREQQGAGLGLALVKRLTEMASGTFAIKSVQHELTTVTVSVPLADPNALVHF